MDREDLNGITISSTRGHASCPLCKGAGIVVEGHEGGSIVAAVCDRCVYLDDTEWKAKLIYLVTMECLLPGGLGNFVHLTPDMQLPPEKFYIH